MSTKAEIDEAVSVVIDVTNLLKVGFTTTTGEQGAAFREARGDIIANAVTYINNGTIGTALLLCFTTAAESGASMSQFRTVLDGVLALAPKALIAVAVQQASERFALSQMSQALAATTFVSRDDAISALDVMSVYFGSAIEDAVDEHDSGTYQALIAMSGAVTRDLADRAILLPQTITITYPATQPSLWVAQRVYQDGSKADTIVLENKVVHPLFCPRVLRLISPTV